MKKIIAAFLVFTLALSLVSCGKSAVLDESKTYDTTSEIHSLNIRVSAADFKIEHGDVVKVISNLKYLSVSEEGGVLTIVDKAKSNSNYSGAALTLYVPNGAVFDDVSITTGAAKINAAALSARTLKLELGAADVRFESLSVSSDAEIKGGAGKITIAGGTLNDMELEMGMGELDLTATLLGRSELDFGVGEANITLIGNKDEYKMNIEKGLGSITVDGKVVSDYGSSGNGQNSINIDGGVGAINLMFRDE